MSARSSDFNYKVALASGLKSLQSGKLRQAEEQFRYLVTHFPMAEGGYRGLAKVLVEQEDRPAALRTLLDGGAALAKAGVRSAAIAVYREAVALEPRDLTSHRRLAAALILAGDESAATTEFSRYIRAAIESGDGERARLEAAYAQERLPNSREIAELVRAAGTETPRAAQAPTRASASAAPAQDREALMRSAFGRTPPAPAAPPPTPARAPDAWQSPAPSDAWQAAATTPADAWGEAVAPIDPRAATLGAVPDGEAIAADADALAVEATAARFLAKRDPRGGEAALEAARRYIADGRMDAASDLLLQLIASGVADHEAQRLLVGVVKTLGKRDVARAKCQLLVQALRLDGRDDLAAEVEALAQAD